jgi:membrane glycosyltransferase
MLAVPLSKASSSAAFGRWLARCGILRIPEEMHPPDLVRRRDDIARTLPPLPTDGLWYLARNSQSRLTHLSHNLPPPPGPRGYPDGSRLTAERKIRDAQTLQEALQWLTPSERMLVAADAGLLEHLAMLPDV